MKFINKLKFWLSISFKYFKSGNKRKRIIFVFLFLGITLGLSTFIVILGIMNGLQDNHISRRIEIGSYHLEISKKNNESFNLKESGKLKDALYEKFDKIEAVIPFSEKEVILKSNANIEIVKLRAVDPYEIKKDSRFLKYFKVNKNLDFSERNTIILGNAITDELLIDSGETVYLTSDISVKSFKRNGEPFKIKDTFFTNSYTYDRHWGFISIFSLLSLTGKLDVDKIGIKLITPKKADRLKKEILLYLGDNYLIKTSEELNRSYFSALKLEKILIMLLFLLIFIIVAVNSFGALKLTILEKRMNIGILKAVGASPNDITAIFLLEGIILAILSSIAGLILGVVILYNIENIFIIVESVINFFYFHFVLIFEKIFPGLYFNPVDIYDESIYYQSKFPVKLYVHEIIIICTIIINLIILAAIIPILKISKLKPNLIIKN